MREIRHAIRKQNKPSGLSSNGTRFAGIKKKKDSCKTRAMLLTGQEQEKTRFFMYSSRFLVGFERLSAEATSRTPANTAKM